MKMKAERQSNIELARLVAVAGVIILHYNNPKIGGDCPKTRADCRIIV